MKNAQVTEIVVNTIKKHHPTLWEFARKNSYKDDAGNHIHVREDGIAWETAEWVDYEILDEINEQVERLDLDVELVVEYSNSYEVLVEAL